MKNSTINKLMYLAICFLSIFIIFISFKIITRPHPIYEKLDESVSTIDNSEQESLNAAVPDAPVEEPTNDNTTTLHGKTSSRVNIRELPSTDSRVLTTVEKDYSFNIIEIMDNGWTKIVFGDSQAYISSDFVILVQGN